MALDMSQEVQLPACADFHVHLRDDIMMETVVPTIRDGGCDMVYVMVEDSSNPFTRILSADFNGLAESCTTHRYR